MKNLPPATDRAVWDLEPGSILVATQTLHQDHDPAEPRRFTAGQGYAVKSVHPLADPPAVKVINDQGQDNWLTGEHILAWFTTARSK
jgi:hypothetical protein